MPIDFDAMDEYNRQPEPAPEEKSILDNIWDNVKDTAELVVDTLDDGLQALRVYNAVAGGRGDISLEQAEDNLKMSLVNRPMNAFVNKFADSDTPLLSSFADSIQSSELAYTQIIPDEKKWEQARKIQQEIGIPAETVMYDQTAWKNANNLYDEYQKAKEFYGPDMSQEDIKQINPIIQKVSTADPAAGALIMADAYNTSKELSIIDTFNEYFEMGKMEMELNELGEKYREQKHSQEDLKRIKELQGQINDFYNKHNINFIDDPLASIAAEVGQSAPITMESMYSALEDQAAWSASLAWAGAGVGSVGGPAGSATGALIGGASGATIGFLKNLPKLTKTGLLLLKVNKGILAKNFVGEQLAKGAGKSLGSTIGATRGMLDSEIGGKYIEYRDMKDENGNPLMDHDEASTRAVITGSATSFLEVVPTVETLGRMTKGSKLYKQAVEEVFDAAGMKYTRKAVATDAAVDFAKNTFKGAFTESSEEMFQNITEDLMLNDIEATHNDKANGGVKPYTDIILDGMGAFVASYPTSLAFGVGGAAGSGIFSSSQYAARRRNISRQEKMFGAELKNTAIGNALAADLQEAVHDSKLKQSAPDVQKQIIHEKAAGTGFENVYIDVEMALEKENGKEDLRAVAKAANISDEELEIAIEEKGTLSVPLECFAQSDSSQELLESASYNAETKSIARMKKEAKSTMESIKKAYDENLVQQERIINTIITELFPTEENDKVSIARQDMAKSIIMTFSENPAMGWREMMKLVQDERMEIICGALKYLQETSGNGVSIIPTEDGKGVRASNNAQWYSDFYSEHGRKPTKAELEDIAEDMMRGKVSIGDYHNIPEEELQATNAALDEINGKIKALEEIKDKMLGLTGVEMKLTEGLSKEAYAGYRQIMDQLQHAPAKAVRAARMNAILLARHADLYAKIMQKKGNNDYTAKDYMDSVALRFGGQNLGGFSQLGAEVEKQKAAIRKKYEGTDKWMKAPNGKPTNLTEEQWLAVRTPAFKEWFGDWEAAIPANEIIKMPAVEVTLSDTLNQKEAEARFTAFGNCINERYGVTATFPKGTVGKIIRHKGFNVTRIIDELPGLFEHSILALSEPEVLKEGHKQHPNVELYHHFVNKFSVGEKEYYIRFTAIENKSRKKNNPDRIIHSTGISSVNIYETNNKGAHSQRIRVIDPGEESPAPFVDFKLSQILDNVNTASKVVDVNGEPLVVHHGTKAKFNTFESVDNTYFFSESSDYAEAMAEERNGNTIYDVFLNIKNPLIIELPENRFSDPNSEKPYIKQAKEQGNDGVAFKNNSSDGFYHDVFYVAFEPTQIKSAVANNGNYDINDPNIYHQMAGERAKTAALNKLEKAKAMEAEGKLSDDIYKETGWLKGKDGKWRFEIPDDLDAIKADEFIAEGEDAVWTLGQLYKNEKLYEAYPFLENVKVRLSVELARNVNGSVRGAEIEINYKDGKVTAYGLKKTLVHEIQHVIQDKEGFASGGSMDSVRIQVEAALSSLRRTLESGLVIKENSAVDLDKLLDQRSDLIGKSNEAVFDGDINKANAIQDEVKNVEDKIQELLPNRNLEEVFKIDGQIRYLEKRMKDYYKAEPGEDKEAILYEMYKDLAGEQEARTTTFRALMLNDKKNEALKADKEAGSLGLAFEKEYKNAPEEIRELADEHSKLSAEYEQLEGEAKKDSFQRMEAIEKQLNETEQGAKLLSAMEERWFAEWEKEEAWDRVREFSGSNPQPHSYGAIVVYGGESFSVENQQKKEIDKFINSTAIPVESKVFVGDEKQKAHIKAINWFKKEFGISKTIPTIIGDIVIHYQGIKSSLAHKYSQKKLDCVYSVVKGMKQASYIKSIPDYDDKRITNHFFVYKVIYEGEENFVLCRIREQNNVKKFYIHEVGTAEEIKLKSDTLQARADGRNNHETPRGIALYTSILSEFSNKIKEQKFGKNLNNNNSPLEDGTFNQGIKGSLTPMADGQRIITLFESADESTFLHEMGHLFLLDLEELAKIDEQSAKELAKVTKWAAYKKSDVKGYKGSPFEGEFLKLAADIEAAEKAGDVATAEKLKRRWMHERFARGFEMYLEFGEAPSKGLKAVFRKFKQFLKVLYFGFAGQGVRATPEVERIMARMIASDTEIEAMALDSRYKDITKAGGEKLLEETEAQTMQRWHEEAKEEAKEKLMAIIMKDLSEEKKREKQAKIDKEREEVTTFMTSMPVYIAQKVIAETGSKEAVVEMGIYSNIEQLESDLEAVKDIPLDKAIEDHMADYEADLDKQQMDEEMTEEKLSKIMNQTYYHNKLLALETAALQERTRTMQRINSKAKNAIHEANVAIDGLDDDVEIKLDKNSPKVKAVLRALAKLRYADRWGTEDLQAIDKIINSSTKSEIAAALKEFEANSGQWKKNLKILQEAFDGQHRIIENAAKNDLAKKKLIDACAYRHYVSMEKNASNLMNMFIRQGKWEAALRQQQFRLQAAAMAKYAKKNQEKLKKLTDKVTKQLSARTVKVAKDERYWHRHLAYLLGLNKEAPVKPDELISAIDLFKIFNDLLNVNEKDDEFNKKLMNIYEKVSRQDFGGYMTLTMAELEDAVDMLTVLYTTGRDKFRMKSFDGKMLHEVVDEICWDETGINIMTQNRYINPDTGGLGYNDILAKVPFIGENLSRVGQKYINAHIKPEELLKLVGEKAHKYIYGLYERAANEEGKMTADSVQKLKDILSVYSHAEKREWKKQKYIFESGAGTEKISKENIICMALNRGNETNWHRLFRGLRVDPAYLANFIDEHMTEKDWDTVQALWDHIGSYWSQTVKVEEKLNGVTLRGVEPKEFIVNLPDGRKKNIRGGYYPIAQNEEKSHKAEEHSVDEAARRTMKGPQVFGAGRKFVNKRSDNLNIEIPLKLSFDVIPNHLGDVIHNITYRIAARDVYRLVSAKKFENLIKDTLGAEAYRSITDWAVDCWKIMPNNTSQAEGTMNKWFGFLRRNATFNIMGYRMWPVIENSTNIFPMMDRLGVVNALSAIGDYYAHKKECDLMMLKSSFMTNRINSMDRDIKTMPGLFDEDMKGLGWMKQHAYSMMVYSDLMLSAPLWARAYKDSIAGHYVDVERENKEMVDALRAAQAKVDDLNAQMFDLKKEKQHILEQLHPGYEVEYSPQRMRAVGYLNSELARIKSQLEPMEKALWEAEKELDKLANVDLMLPDDILKEAEVRAIQTADGAVRNVFGSGHPKDLAPIQKGGEFAKMFTCFYSFFNTQANAILANYYKGKFAKEELTGLQNIAVWMPFAKSVLFRIFLTSALSTILKMAFGLDGDDDKDKYRKVINEDGTENKVEIPSLERFLTQYAKNTISTASGTMVGVRDVASLVCTYLFDGYDMGGSKAGSVPTAAIDKAYKTFVLMSKQDERNAKIAADKERRKARYEKMSPKQKKKFDEELQYRHPAKRITYADIAKSGVGTVTSVLAAQIGITDTMANTVMTTLQYMADGDGRYDPSLSNIMWSAFWNKKPVEREIPEKPVKPKKNKKGA